MPSNTDRANQLLGIFRSHGGVASSAELAIGLGMSQPSVSRALKPLIQSGRVHITGAARSQRYLLARAVRDVGTVVPLWRIDGHGQPQPFARLLPLEGGGFWVDEEDGLSERHDGLPWFLADMRPQGFMGRNFAHAHPELQLPADTRHWSDDDALRALALAGEDLPGNLLVGDASRSRFDHLAKHLVRADSPADYCALALGALQGTLPGSSAGGEQPKFCCVTAGRSVIVKFSSAGNSAADRRSRDLLLCEQIALQVLANVGLPAAPTRAFTIDGRVFLESERFDRFSPWLGDDPNTDIDSDSDSDIHTDPPGRLGMVSLLVYDAQYIGEMDTWSATAGRMRSHQPPLLTEGDARTLRLLDAYGKLIGNTDRHYGNISLVLVEDDWRLSPTYDMLPMLYMPIAGEIVARAPSRESLIPTDATRDVWDEARTLALAFWAAVAGDDRVSSDFQVIARSHASAIASQPA